MSTLDGGYQGRDQFQLADSGDAGRSTFNAADFWGPPAALDRHTVSDRTAMSSNFNTPLNCDSLPSGLSQTSYRACAQEFRPHEPVVTAGSIPWNTGRHSPGQFVPIGDREVYNYPTYAQTGGDGLVVIQKSNGGGNTGYQPYNPWQNQGWRGYGNQGGDSKTIVVTGGGNQTVHDTTSRVRVGNTEVYDDATVVNGHPVLAGDQIGRRSSGVPGLEGWTPKEVIGLVGVVGETAIGMRNGGRHHGGDFYDPYGDNRNFRWQNNPNQRWQNNGQWQNQGGNRSRNIIVQGGQNRVYDRSEGVRVGNTEVYDDVTIINGGRVGTPPFVPGRQNGGWTPKETIGLIGVMGDIFVRSRNR
ncbi:hypothetical protein GC174_08345 [bacterium]|nr:hypothetical protein [bacterium]